MLIGYALCGSFCTFDKSLAEMAKLKESGYELLPIMSENAYATDTRFGTASEITDRVIYTSGRQIIHTVKDAEPLGPRIALDLLIIAPCTGNTLAKLANGITDTAVTMAAKAHLRNGRPLLITLASNDAMSANLANLATLLNRKNIFFTPLIQDDTLNKPNSLVADFDKLGEATTAALEGRQLRPLFI